MEQRELLERVIAIGVNIVTCGRCGSVLLHDTDDEEVTCPHCYYENDTADFPDLFMDEPDTYYRHEYLTNRKA